MSLKKPVTTRSPIRKMIPTIHSKARNMSAPELGRWVTRDWRNDASRASRLTACGKRHAGRIADSVCSPQEGSVRANRDCGRGLIKGSSRFEFEETWGLERAGIERAEWHKNNEERA